jgi:trimethylamine--corrinoid protein Co-methyltransferase
MGSFATGAKEPNWQAGIDNSLSTFMASLTMSDMLLGVGLLHGSRIWSYEQMLMDCEIFDLVACMMEGIVVDEETLAFEAIQSVGPGGNFLTQPHTRKHARERWIPQFMDRRPYEIWEQRWLGLGTRAQEILKNHQPDPLDPHLSMELSRIITSLENSI